MINPTRKTKTKQKERKEKRCGKKDLASVGESTNQIIGNAIGLYCSESIFPGLGHGIIKQKKQINKN